MKVVLAGYRAWALESFVSVINRFPEIEFIVVKNPKDLQHHTDSIVLGAGWSWIFPSEFLKDNKVVALMHPSALPNYAGGSPIQHQIIDGVTSSQATLFKVVTKIDAGPILYQEPISLCGHIEDVFNELKKATEKLFVRFLLDYPEVREVEQRYLSPARKRLKPSDSRLTSTLLERMSCEELYNFIRCREDPYPNVYIEDDAGKLLIKRAVYIKKEDDLK